MTGRIAGFLMMAQTAVLMVAGTAGAMLSDTCNQEMWVTNGPVYTIVPAGKMVYIGGSFWYVGPYTGSFAPIDKATGSPVTTFPKINGSVCAVCQDRNGGWYVGGNFTTVNGVSRNGIAHIRADGSLDANWNPNADVGGYNGVWALAVSGTTVYVGGTFTSIGGATRNNIAALDATTGTATAWNPNANSGVGALAVSGTTVYAGGNFSSIGGATRNNIAALDSATGTAISWNPNANYLVNVLVLSGSTVYAGGEFTSIGGQPRSCIAALDAATGNATVWNPNATDGYNTRVDALVMNGTTVYAGGIFDSIGGQLRSCIAALDATTGNATAWNPNASGGYLTEVHALAVSGTTVYAGGDFNNIGGQPRRFFAALDAATGNATAWNPIANDVVVALAVSGTTVYVGGGFYSIGGQLRSCIAALDSATGNATAWNPNARSSYYGPSVNVLAVSGTTVYVGGDFDTIGGATRNNIAALDAATGNATAWNPNAGGSVDALAVSETTVYAGGGFDTIGGQPRNYIAALDAATGTATTWNPNASGGYYSSSVLALAVSGTTVYAGGDFTSIGGATRNYIAALDATTGTATAWNPNAGLSVYALAVSGTTVYAGGGFDTIGGQPRNCIAALDATTGNATAWNPNAGGSVDALAVSGTSVYAGGGFTSIGGQPRNHIAAIDATTGTATAWNPGADTVTALAVNGTTVYVGVRGWYPRQIIGQGIGHPSFAEFDDNSITPVSQPSKPVSAVSQFQFSVRSGNLTYTLPSAGRVSVRLYNLSGRQIATPVNAYHLAGTYSVSLSGKLLSAGVCLATFQVGDYKKTEKIVTLR
ncbi:MAG: hypothetical protein ABSF80_06580 [Chitinispirillaceae bacterium]